MLVVMRSSADAGVVLGHRPVRTKGQACAGFFHRLKKFELAMVAVHDGSPGDALGGQQSEEFAPQGHPLLLGTRRESTIDRLKCGVLSEFTGR